MSEKNQIFKYPQCKKGQYHVGEALSLVCIEPKCIEQCVICGICLDESHKTHKIKPLKMMIKNAKRYLSQMTPVNMDSKALKQSIKQSQKNILTKYDEFEDHVKKVIKQVRNSLEAVFIKIIEQIQLKTGSNDQLLRSLDQISEQEIETEKFISLMKKLLAGIPLDKDIDESEVTDKEIQSSINSITKKMEKDLEKKSQVVKKQLDSFMNSLQKTVDNPCIFDSNIEFKYSSQFKHNGVEVISDNLVKSIEAYNYHFVLMQPSIQQKGNKAQSVAFKIKQNHSNWIAVGLCHKNIVKNKSYQFEYSTLGHGGYMISSNGGSWSSIDSSKNNVVNSFHFAKGDTIIVSYQPSQNHVVFTKQGTQQTHIIQFQNKDDDELYLTNLFYYNNDEVEYLGPSKMLNDEA